MTGWARVDGVLHPLDEAVIPATDRGFLTGWTVFETALAKDGRIPALHQHIARLRASCAEAEIPFPDGVADEMAALAARLGGLVRLRVTVSGTGLRIVSAEPTSFDRLGAPVRCATGAFAADPFISGAVKHGSRAGWMVAVQRAGVDDVLLVDGDGCFTEGTTCGILAVVDGALWVAPNDGRILPSTTIETLTLLAADLGLRVVRKGASAKGPWDGLYIASATRGLAPVVELDGVALGGWEPVGRSLLQAFAARAGVSAR